MLERSNGVLDQKTPLPIFLLREFPEVIVQLQRSDSPDCWEAVFTDPPNHDTRWVFADTVH